MIADKIDIKLLIHISFIVIYIKKIDIISVKKWVINLWRFL